MATRDNDTFETGIVEVNPLGGPGGRTSAVRLDMVGTSGTPIHFATSTATTTKDIQIGEAEDIINLNFRVTASTTATRLQWTYAFSRDGTNFFAEDTKSVAGTTVTHGAATTTHQWTPAQTVTAFKNVEISNVHARFVRLTVSKPLKWENFTLWIEAISINED